MKTVASDRKTIFSKRVGNGGGTADAGKTSAIYVELPMEAVGHIFHGGYFHDAAELATVFGGKCGGQHAHRFHVVGVTLRRKGWRAILGERQPIENILHIVFRSARMQNAVSFIQRPGVLIGEGRELLARMGGSF